MFSYSYIKVSNIFTIIGFIAEFTLKFIDDTRCKFLGKIVFPRNLHLVLSMSFSVDSAMNPIMVNALDTLM